jgi:hypothetical protein
MNISGNVLAAIVYTGFFGAISVACFVTGSGLPLFALFLAPKFKSSGNE